MEMEEYWGGSYGEQEPEDYIFSYLNVNDSSWSKEIIEQKIKEVSQDHFKSKKVLEYWIKNGLSKNKNTQRIKSKLTAEQVGLLINGLKKDDTNEQTIGYKLLKTIEDKKLFNIKLPYFKDLLEKERNEYLLMFYFNKSFDTVIDIKEEELIKYISNVRTNEYKSDFIKFIKECFNLENPNNKKTAKLLNFAIELVDIKESRDILKEWFFKIKTNKKNDNLLINGLKSINVEEILKNKKILNNLSPTILSSISYIEEIWNITINKEELIKEIDFNKINYIYEDIGEQLYVQRRRLMGYKTGIFNIWNELIKQKNTNGDKTFSNEIIEKILNSLNIENREIQSGLIFSLFDEQTKNYNFLKELIREDEKTFEKLINRILYAMSRNNSKEIVTDFTNKLLRLKAEVEFNEELIIKAINLSDQEKIKTDLINAAHLISLMNEKELNDIDVAYSLVNKNKKNFHKLGKQLIEFLQLDKDNSEIILNKYKDKNLKGIFNYYNRQEKIKIQNKINQALIYEDEQKLKPIIIKEEVEKINLNKLNKQEKEKIELILSSLDNINKEILKDLLLIENSQLKNCMEKTFLGTVKNYSKISELEKQVNSELIDNFNEIMDYCLIEVNKAINKNKVTKIKP